MHSRKWLFSLFCSFFENVDVVKIGVGFSFGFAEDIKGFKIPDGVSDGVVTQIECICCFCDIDDGVFFEIKKQFSGGDSGSAQRSDCLEILVV